MKIHNNRYRASYVRYRDYFQKKWRLYAVLSGICLLISMFVISWLMQWLNHVDASAAGYHLLNPFHIVYYSLGKGGLLTIMLWLTMTFAVGYYKFYIDMVDYEMDPRGFAISPNGTYGTNRIMSDEERNKFISKTTIDKTDKNVIYKDKDGSVYVLTNPNGMGPHKFVSGASGSWKTSSVFIPDMMQTIKRGESMICTDPKGELRSKTYKMAKRHNYIVREFNLIQPILSDGCDFMKLVETYGDARTFTEIIMSNTSNDTSHDEDFWAKGERAAICFGILYVKEADEFKGNRTFKNVFEFLKNDLETLNAKAEALDEGSDAKNQWKIFQTTPDNSKGGIMTGVATRLQILNDQSIANITSRDEIDITLPGKRPCIYYVLMSDQESTNNVIASIFFSFMFIKMAKMADMRFDQRLPIAVNFLLDEMPNIGRIPDFPKKLSTIRSRNMRCTICTQDIGQIKDMYPGNLWANVVSNCDTQVMLGCNDSEVTAPFWSNAYGTMTIIVETERVTASRFAPITVNSTPMQNTGEGKREVFTIGEICGLENEYALIRFRGHNVIKGLKFSYFEHPMYEEIEEENYFKHKPLWWNAVAAEAQNAQNLKEYEWFVQGIKNIEEQNIKMQEEEELEKKKEKEKKIAEDHKIDRVANGAGKESNADIMQKLKAGCLIIKRHYEQIKAYLENNISDKEGEDVSSTRDVQLENALKESVNSIGEASEKENSMDLTGTEDDHVIGAEDERVVKGSSDADNGSEAAAEGEPDEKPNKRLQKRIHSNFKEAPEEKKKASGDHKKSFAASLETSSVMSKLAYEVKKNDEMDTRCDTKGNTDCITKDSLNDMQDETVTSADTMQEEIPEPDDIPEIPEPDFDEPQAGIPWADSWGSFGDDYDEPDEPELAEPEFKMPDPEKDTDCQATDMQQDQMIPPGRGPDVQQDDQTPDTSNILGALMKAQQRQDEKKNRIQKRMTTKTGGI